MQESPAVSFFDRSWLYSYDLIVIDPPWPFKTWSKPEKVSRRRSIIASRRSPISRHCPARLVEANAVVLLL